MLSEVEKKAVMVLVVTGVVASAVAAVTVKGVEYAMAWYRQRSGGEA